MNPKTALFAAVSSGTDSGSLELKMKLNQGWKWIEFHTHGGNKKFKPGWVTETAGSEIQMEVDTSFPSSRSSSLVLLYLTSYEHMGIAQLSCVSGCTCLEVSVDAHKDKEKISVIHLLKHDVSSSPACVISLKTLSTTSSGGHRWKLVQVAVTTNIDALPVRDHTRHDERSH